MGLLGVLDLGLVDRAAAAGRYSGPYCEATSSPGGLDRHRGQVGRVGSHVGDVPVLVQALGHLHRVPGGEAVLAVGLLLQRAGGKRRIGPGRVGLVFHGRHAARRRGAAARPSSPACRWSKSSSAGSLSWPVAGSKSRPAGMRRPSTETSSASKVLAVWPWRTCPAGPNRWPARTPSAAARARRSTARPRSARGRPRAAAGSSATTAAKPRSRTAGR